MDYDALEEIRRLMLGRTYTVRVQPEQHASNSLVDADALAEMQRRYTERHGTGRERFAVVASNSANVDIDPDKVYWL